MRPFSEHLAGETLTKHKLSKDIRVAHISLQARSSVTIELTAEPKHRIRMDGLRAMLVIEEGSKLMLKGRDAARLAHQFLSGIQTVTVLGFGLGRAATQVGPPLTGSLVGNLVLSGAFGPGAGLWLLGHIMYGDLKVSRDSENGLIKSLGRNDEGLRINVDIDARIVASIHAVTDGRKEVYLCLSRNRIFKVRRKSNLLSASLCDGVDVKSMMGCSIAPRRGLC